MVVSITIHGHSLFIEFMLLIRTWTRSYHYGMEMSYPCLCAHSQDPQAEGIGRATEDSKSIESRNFYSLP